MPFVFEFAVPLSAAAVVKAWPGMARGDRVDLTWTGATVFTAWPPLPALPAPGVAQAEGETVRVGYRVTCGAEEKASPFRLCPIFMTPSAGPRWTEP